MTAYMTRIGQLGVAVFILLILLLAVAIKYEKQKIATEKYRLAIFSCLNERGFILKAEQDAENVVVLCKRG